MKNYKFSFFASSIAITLLFYIYFLYTEQRNSYKDLYVELCEKDCKYFFPKELNPTIISSGSNNRPSIHLDYKINTHRIPIRLNLADHKFKYIITTKEYEINEKFGVIKKSNQFDPIYKKFYHYFYDKNGTKVGFLDNSFVLKIEKKLKNDLLVYYNIPSELISEVVAIDETITETINSFKVNEKNEQYNYFKQ